MIRGIAEVRLIDAEGQQVGIVPLQQAQDMAREKDLDLVEISAAANPPVCKIMDYGKYIFQQKKKQAEAKKKQKVIIVKEVQFRPRIDEHDFEFKKNNVIRFLQHGDKVKAAIRFRGREMTHMELGRAVLDRLLADVKEFGAAENSAPDVQGNRMTIVIAPNKAHGGH
jgi:translation initiation factor IF-3